ncbi:sigma factor-like helix-turn-helix DNA-binding protein, partial [Nonomuraea sp. NPDC003201]
LAINATQSARVRRETYLGPWLPEPVDTGADPYLGAERAEALEFAVLLLLERLSPTERAAYVLREAFDYPYRQIADILELNEPAIRQLVSRARKRVLIARPTPVTQAEQRRLLTAFVAAARSGDMTALEELFAADVIGYSDGAVRASRLWSGLGVAWASTKRRTCAPLKRVISPGWRGLRRRAPPWRRSQGAQGRRTARPARARARWPPGSGPGG